MKCEKCRFLHLDGSYEYPESYCAAGITDADPKVTGDGCSYHFKTLEKRYKEIWAKEEGAHE